MLLHCSSAAQAAVAAALTFSPATSAAAASHLVCLLDRFEVLCVLRLLLLVLHTHQLLIRVVLKACALVGCQQKATGGSRVR